MSDLSFTSVLAAFASPAPTRRDADSRADASFAAALDEVVAADDAVPVRARPEPAQRAAETKLAFNEVGLAW
jgi:hypothetical protein